MSTTQTTRNIVRACWRLSWWNLEQRRQWSKDYPPYSDLDDLREEARQLLRRENVWSPVYLTRMETTRDERGRENTKSTHTERIRLETTQ